MFSIYSQKLVIKLYWYNLQFRMTFTMISFTAIDSFASTCTESERMQNVASSLLLIKWMISIWFEIETKKLLSNFIRIDAFQVERLSIFEPFGIEMTLLQCDWKCQPKMEKKFISNSAVDRCIFDCMSNICKVERVWQNYSYIKNTLTTDSTIIWKWKRKLFDIELWDLCRQIVAH